MSNSDDAERKFGPNEVRRLFDFKKARERLDRERNLGIPLSEIWERLGVAKKAVNDGTNDG
jgi:hypothetical protein